MLVHRATSYLKTQAWRCPVRQEYRKKVQESRNTVRDISTESEVRRMEKRTIRVVKLREAVGKNKNKELDETIIQTCKWIQKKHKRCTDCCRCIQEAKNFDYLMLFRTY